MSWETIGLIALGAVAGAGIFYAVLIASFSRMRWHRDSDGTATAAANEDLPVPKDCQARAEGIAKNPSNSIGSN